MLGRKPELMQVTKEIFELEMLPLNEGIRAGIQSYISLHKDITKYEFAHIPGERVFRVSHADGTTKTWDLTRHRHRRSFLRRFFG